MKVEQDWLKKWAHYSPSRVALRDGLTNEALSYSDFYRHSLKLAGLLESKKLCKKGDRVAVLASNCLEYVVLYFALQRLGLTLVPINFRLTPREVQHILDDSGASLLLFSKDLSETAQALEHDHRLLLDSSKGLYQEALKSNESFEDYLSEAEDIAMILYTSGTTGSPKGAMLSHRMLFWNSINTGLRLNLTQQDRTLIFLPLFHTGGWNVLTTPFFHRGAEIILLPKFEAEQVLQLSQQHKATILFGVPTTMNMLAQSADFSEADLSSIRYAIVGGEAMPRSLIEVWHKKGVPIRQGYGLTEFGPNVFSLNEEDAIRKIGSIGFANFYIEAKVVDDQGNELPNGEIGELVLSGPCAMSGYWQNPEATEQTIKDGRLHTGDLVLKDEEGYFFVAGRKKEMFISGGENVYPAEIEQVLHSLDAVKEVAVVGVSDAQWGEVGKAFLSFKSPEQGMTAEELEDHCRKNLARFKIPKSFEILSELPKGDSGKILKRKLLEL